MFISILLDLCCSFFTEPTILLRNMNQETVKINTNVDLKCYITNAVMDVKVTWRARQTKIHLTHSLTKFDMNVNGDVSYLSHFVYNITTRVPRQEFCCHAYTAHTLDVIGFKCLSTTVICRYHLVHLNNNLTFPYRYSGYLEYFRTHVTLRITYI